MHIYIFIRHEDRQRSKQYNQTNEHKMQQKRSLYYIINDSMIAFIVNRDLNKKNGCFLIMMLICTMNNKSATNLVNNK